jgi:transcriptional regulator with XRE-family HTH domain
VERVAGHRDHDEQLVRLGSAVRTRRKTVGLSQEALADASGIDRSHMGKIERGERNVTLLNLSRIAAALHALPSELLREAGL